MTSAPASGSTSIRAMPHVRSGSAASGSTARPAWPGIPTATRSVTRSPTRLLGAAALGDVGEHFPDTDPAFEGIGGLELLGRVVALIAEAGHAPGSCDVTVLCERPAIAPRRDEMRAALARVLDLPLERVSVKATRPEGLGLSGDGIGCLALATLR